MRELALSRPRYGYRRLHILLRRERWSMNLKKTYRLYKEERLSLRVPRKKRKYASVVRIPPRKPERPNELWAIDFMSDAQIDGRKFRVLTVIDICSRKALSVTAERSFPSRKATAVLDRLIAEHGKPDVITLDNGCYRTP